MRNKGRQRRDSKESGTIRAEVGDASQRGVRGLIVIRAGQEFYWQLML